MASSNFIEQFNELAERLNAFVDSIISGGSRYQVEKLVIIVVYLIVSVASLIWAFSSGDAENELGAKFQVEALDEIDGLNLHLINDGSSDWTGVRVVLNRKYLWTADEVEAESQVSLRPQDFQYYYYVPRSWGRSEAEMLAEDDKPGSTASSDLEVELVQVRARQGASDITLDEEQASGESGEEVEAD